MKKQVTYFKASLDFWLTLLTLLTLLILLTLLTCWLSLSPSYSKGFNILLLFSFLNSPFASLITSASRDCYKLKIIVTCWSRLLFDIDNITLTSKLFSKCPAKLFIYLYLLIVHFMLISTFNSIYQLLFHLIIACFG